MNIKIAKNLFLLFFVLLVNQLIAQQPISFKASTDAKQVVVGGYFEVSFTLENAQGQDFQPPVFKDFNVVSGPSQSISTSSFNGNWSRTLTYSYELRPKRIGKFKIGPASINAGGKKYTTKPFQVEVVKGKNNTATTQEELLKQIETQIYIKAIPSSIDARVGEQIILDYKIFTTKQVESYSPANEIDYAGFFAEELGSYNSELVKEVIDGIQYTTKIIKKVALFPQQAGILEILPLKMQIGVASPNQNKRKRRSFFSRPELIRIQVSSELLNINVREFPDNPPASFSGAVGHYSITAKTNSRQINTNDAFSIQLTVRGDGDLKQVQAPDLMLGDSFEIVDTKVVAENALVAQQGRFVGAKVFDYLISPKYAGQFQLRPKFTYYDVDSLAYTTLGSEPLAINILQGDQSKAVIPKSDEAIAAIRGIVKTANWKKKSTSLFGSPLFFILMGLPFLLLGGAYFYKKRQFKLSNVDAEALRRQRANKVALKRLETANSFLNENKSRQFYDEVSRAMLDYVSDKLNIPFSKMSKDNVRDKLLELNVSETPIQQFIHVIKTSEMALFAGKDNSESMQEVYAQAVEVVSGVESEIGNEEKNN